MSEYLDEAETQAPEQREEALFRQLPNLIAHATGNAEGWATHLAGIDPQAVTDRAALARLPVLRKPELMQAQKVKPPFGGFVVGGPGTFTRVFVSPGPIYEPQAPGLDPWKAARALYAAGFRKGDIIHNSFAYHMTPGGFILDEGARALGCAVLPAGIGNTEAQVEAMAALKPAGYMGTPDYLKTILEAGDKAGADLSSVTKALVSGGALFPSLREWYQARGVSVVQAYATADLGVIAYESAAREGLIVNERTILEIVRPGTNDPVPEGEVGEVVVTAFNPVYPLIRFGTGDLSAILPGTSPCGRTGQRIKGWMGRADQRTKIKGMFVDPAQIAALLKRHPEVVRARLVVDRKNEQDVMTLRVETEAGEGLKAALEDSLKDIVKLKGAVERVVPGSLPNDGKVIDDVRPAVTA